MTLKIIIITVSLITSIIIPMHSQSDNPCIPVRIKVWPVFFKPLGALNPTESQINKLKQHLILSQTRFFEMMDERSTFLIADQNPLVFQGEKPNSFYTAQLDGGAGAYIDELLNYLNYTRFNCPYIFLVVYMNPNSTFPGAGGRPMNAGFNTGGGVIILSVRDLNHLPFFQAILQHELGHSFGLTHVDEYGYNMDTNPSIMSYNPEHLNPNSTSGILIPEDLRGLALNKMVFPEMYFDPDKDIPDSYLIHPDLPALDIFPIPNQSDYAIKISSISPSGYGTSLQNMVQNRIKPNTVGMGVQFDSRHMWHSMASHDWITIDATFPISVTLDKIGLHSQHSGLYHKADSIEIQVLHNGNYTFLIKEAVLSPDQWFAFPENTSDSWRLLFKPGSSAHLTIRGLQFYYSDEEVFPPIIPYAHQNPFASQLPSKPDLINPINHQVINELHVHLFWNASQADFYRLQIDTTQTFCTPIINTILPSGSFSFQAPERNKTYYWRTKGLNSVAYGFGDWSEINNFYVKTTSTGIVESDNTYITIYPNPIDDFFRVEVSDTESIQSLEVFNVTGNLMKRLDVNNKYIFVESGDLEPGAYFLRALVNDTVVVAKILKM